MTTRKLPAGDELQAFPPVPDTNQELRLRSLKDAERSGLVTERGNIASKTYNGESSHKSEVSSKRPNAVVTRQTDGQTKQVKPGKPQTMQKPGHRNHNRQGSVYRIHLEGGGHSTFWGLSQ